MLTNLFPTSKRPDAGVFISKRIEAHRRLGNEVVAFALKPRSRLISRVSSLVGSPPSAVVHPDYTRMSVDVNGIEMALSAKGFERVPPAARLRSVSADLVATCARGKFDVIHAHGLYGMVPAGMVAQHLSDAVGLPFAISVHGSDINRVMPKRAESYARVLSSAGGVAYVSTTLLNRATSMGASNHNSVVIPNGVDCDEFAPTSRARILQSPKEVRVAVVASLSQVKRADEFPAIFRGIANEIRNVSFTVVGDGPMRKSVEESMGGLRVEFLGIVGQDVVAQVLASADVALLPSRDEGWPCVVLESHACATPVIGSDAGGIPEAIGNSEFIVSQGEFFVRRYVDRVVRVLNSGDDWSDLRLRALAHSWQKVAEGEDGMLHHVMAN